MKLPKILVFTPVYSGKDYSLNRFIENIKKFTYPNYEHIVIDNTDDDGRYLQKLRRKFKPLGIQVYRVKRGATTREALARAQNRAREIFLAGDYDYFMSLESDIYPKPNIMERLVSLGQNIITGLYMIGFDHNDTRIPCITVDWKNEETGTVGSRLITKEEALEYMDNGIKEVAAGGMGCALIYRTVMERVAFTYLPGHAGHSDVFFFNDARRLGYRVFVDTEAFCEHENSDWAKVKNR